MLWFILSTLYNYRKTNPADADTDFAGYYTLIEDLNYSTEPGFNVVYFEKAVLVSEGVNEDLYIGFLPDYSGKISSKIHLYSMWWLVWIHIIWTLSERPYIHA